RRAPASEAQRIHRRRRLGGPVELRSIAGLCWLPPGSRRYFPLRDRSPRFLLAGGRAGGLRPLAGDPALRAWVEPIRYALRGFGRLPDGRPGPVRRNQAGGSAIIAVKLASAASLPSTSARPANLQTVARFWTNSTSSVSRTPGSTGKRNFAPSIAMK